MNRKSLLYRIGNGSRHQTGSDIGPEVWMRSVGKYYKYIRTGSGGPEIRRFRGQGYRLAAVSEWLDIKLDDGRR
jgi:hypothetical protein